MSSYPEGVAAFCRKHAINNDEIWNAHGTWVVKHAAIERVAHANGIEFQPPQIIEANSEKQIAVCMVVGVKGDLTEWSFGEAAPKNNKNAYPFAMAEKRAKDRVTLKLLGAHGILYSSEETDDFKPNQRRAVGKSKLDVSTEASTYPEDMPRLDADRHEGRESASAFKKGPNVEVWKKVRELVRGALRDELPDVVIHYQGQSNVWPVEAVTAINEEILDRWQALEAAE